LLKGDTKGSQGDTKEQSMYRARLTHVDHKKYEYRVYIPRFFDDKLPNDQYPKASIGLSYPSNSRMGVFMQEFFKKDVWVWVMLEDNLPNKPVIMGFVSEKQDIPDIETNEYVELNKTYGIRKKYVDENIEIKIDGDLLLSLSNGHKNLLEQLNDIKEQIKTLINNDDKINNRLASVVTKYNTHTHVETQATTAPTVMLVVATPILINPIESGVDVTFEKK